MKKILYAVGLGALGLVMYLGFWPVPIAPIAWTAPAAPGYVDAFAVNDRLANLKIIPLGRDEGPEHVAIGPDGKLYAAVASGAILRMNLDGSAQELYAKTDGRVLGFDFDAEGNLIAADAFLGLLSIAPDRKITPLSQQVNGDPIRYADAVVVAKNGKVYFSDASTRFGAKQWGGTFEASLLDILEQSSSGRVLEYDPKTKATRILAKGLAFANGVALSSDEQSLFVAETGKYRVWRIAVDAKDLDVSSTSAQAIKVFENLPGYPDNLMRGLNGKIWMGLVKPRNPTVDDFANKPFMRQLTLRLPRSLWPVPKAYGHVLAFTEDGKVVANLQDPNGTYPEATGVTETAERLYVHSLHAKGLGWRSP
jgi:sugar lactone lactonase YvrE